MKITVSKDANRKPGDVIPGSKNMIIQKKSEAKWRGDLHWSDAEFKEFSRRIQALRYDQIAALLYLAGIKFSKGVIQEVAKDVKDLEPRQSAYLPILLGEADSKENLRWWLEYFEKANKQECKEGSC